ncbi:MAG TPA: MMPL family transporter [Mycobacteriales bacterium]|nr:MMPL family transporter [Mycobacteriales bacterium]
MNAALERLGIWAARRRWWVIGAWIVILLGLSLGRNLVGGEFVNDYSVPGSESQQGLDRLEADFPAASGYGGQIVFKAGTGTVADQSAAVGTAMKSIGGLPDVISASDPLTVPNTPTVSKDGTIAYGNVSWDVVPTSLDTSYLASMDRAVQPARDAGLTVEYGGGAGQIGQAPDDRDSEIIGLTCALLLLLIMFASIVAAAIPLVAAIFSVGSGLAVVGLLAALTNLPTTAPTVATLLGLGVAVDYGLFLVARHREQLDHGMALEQSIGRTVATSGAAIVVAGSTVVVAILGLYVSGVAFVGALGLASAVVVAVTMLSALTLVPALLAVSGPRVRSRRDRRAEKAHQPRREPDHENSAFARWGRKVSDQPWPWAIASVLVLLVLAIPLLSLRLGQLDAGTDPTSQSSRRAYDLITQGFGPGANGPITVVVDLPAGTDPNSVLGGISTTLQQTDGVASVGAPSVSPSGNTGVLNVIPTTAPDAEQTSALVDRLRDDVLPSTGEQTYLVGTVAGYVDFTEKVAGRMIWLILAVVLLSLILLTVAFRSIVIAVKAAVLNLLSVGAAYGVVIAVFQFGWGSGLLGLDEKVPIPAFVPMLMFAIVFGLSMDYEVFLLSRVHEVWARTGDAHRSVAIGIGSTARVITTAAAIMVVVFSSFVLDSDPTIKMLAVGMAVAVLIDASLVRMILVPALMAILDRRAWWLPAWLDRIIPDLKLEGAEPEPTEPPAAEQPAAEQPAPEQPAAPEQPPAAPAVPAP